MENYFNLIDDDLTQLKIIEENQFDCILKNDDWGSFKWFILSISPNWKSYTICDISFHKSDDLKYKPRLTFRKTNENLQNKLVERNNEFKIIKFERSEDWYNEFWKMIWFLNWFKDLVDLWEFNNQFSIISADDFIVWFKDKDIADKVIDINKIIDSSELSTLEIETLSNNIVYNKRKQSLEVFEKLLKNEENENWVKFITEYKTLNNLTKQWEEIAWHHFLKDNQWILWLNLNLKFIEDFESEWNVWITNTAWTWSPNVDIVWMSDYTILVELKTANKKIFTNTRWNTSRAQTWSFSNDFIDWISQCLAQKTEWDKNHKLKDLIKINPDWEKEILDQNKIRTLDSECIFIIWNWNEEISKESTNPDIILKRDTFQRYRMNSKNITIITFDELYKRALHILELNN